MNEREEPAFWDYLDVLFFIGAMLPTLGIALPIARLMGAGLGFSKPFRLLLMQLIWYVLMASALYLIFKLRYHRPFWRSLGWNVPFPGMTASLLGGPLLAMGLGLLGLLIRTPMIKLPMFDEMMNDVPTRVLLAIFVVVLGPLCEELAFRGFLMPLLSRTFGLTTGILATALLFGALHAPEYGYSWRHVLLISTAGVVFGWARARANSTAASIFLHSTFNLTQFVALFGQPG